MDKQRSLAAIRYLILREKSRLKTWRDIAEVFGISCGMAWRIGMTGYEPKEAKIRAKLRLPSLVPTPACLKCGQVHVTKRCTKVTRRITRWRDLEPEQLRWVLENRHEF